jgi:hypothetical protein
MSLLLLLPTILSLLLLGAHCLRSGNFIFTGLALAALGLLLIRRPWAATLVQLLLLLAAAEWLRAMIQLIQTRQTTGQSWARLAGILGAVVLWNIFSAMLWETPRLRRRFQGPQCRQENNPNPSRGV